MRIRDWFHRRHRFRLALCAHKAAEAGGVCLLMMVGGDLLALTPEHVVVAGKTGLLAVFPAVAVSFTRYGRHLVNRWTSSALLAVCTFLADAAVHPSHYPGEFTEAALTGLGAFAFSVAVSYTVGKAIDRLAHACFHHPDMPAAGQQQVNSR